jgi:hypothetical protein
MGGRKRVMSASERGSAMLRSADKAAEKFSVRHMNDTKWREVLTLFHDPECSIKRILLKFTDRPDVIPSSGQFSLSDFVCDGFPGSFLYREIEWLLIPRRYLDQRGNKGTPPSEHEQSYAELLIRLKELGQLPIRETADGMMIVGYE